MIRRNVSLAVGLLILVPHLVGCQTMRYYRQAIVGQAQIGSSKQPIERLLHDPSTSSVLRQQLRLVLAIRQFAQTELHLPPDGHYLHYADLQRPFVVWNVHAARELSLEPKTWWYPIVGRLKYQGYFSETEAYRYARRLQKKGYDVYVGGVAAYSTLGWFRDPVLNTFVFDDETTLAELLFHELAHQLVFARGDTDFNEAFATSVAEEGLRRWLVTRNEPPALAKVRAQRQREDQFVRLVAAARAKLGKVYEDEESENGRGKAANSPQADSAKRIEKEKVFAELRHDYAQLKAEWGGSGEYDKWFANSLNNAKLNTVDTYYKLVPAFHELLRLQGGDLQMLYREAKALSTLPKAKRHQILKKLLDGTVTNGAE